MKSGSRPGRVTPPLMFAFRESFRQRDAAAVIESRDADGERVLAPRRVTPRSMISETALKSDLVEDLSSLFNTVNLESSIDLDGLDHVRDSILNFGLPDLTTITSGSAKAMGLCGSLKAALEKFEDRLVDGTLQVLQDVGVDAASQDDKIRIQIKADMHAAPADFAVEFMTDIEAGSGRSQVSKI